MDAANSGRLVSMLVEDFSQQRFDLSARDVVTDEPAPGVEEVEDMREHGVSDRTVRLFSTFIMAMNYQRKSAPLWRNGHVLFKARPEFYDPGYISTLSHGSLRRTLADFRVSQKHERDTRAWNGIAQSLREEGPVRRLIDEGAGDATELLGDLRSRGKGRNRFPHLRGAKLAPMWIRVVAEFGRVEIAGINTVLPVAVDVHVRRATENLGVTETRSLSLDKATPEIQDAWREAVMAARESGTHVTCSMLDPILWYFGKYGCSHCEVVSRRIPISLGRACAGCRLPVNEEKQ